MNNEKIKNRIRATLLEMSNTHGTNFIENLNNIVHELENKIDPTENELYILENIYNVLEQLNILKENLNKYNQDQPIFTEGSKLSELFNKQDNRYF